MAELTIIIDNWGHQELEEYLKSLNGILNVQIKNEKQLEIYLKYDSSLISSKIIRMEVDLFLNIRKIPSLVAFNKYPKEKTKEYIIERDDLCCEYCFKGAIEDLYEITGIEKVESNYSEEYPLKKYEEREKVKIYIQYNPNLLSIEEMKKVEENLNI